MPLLRLSQGLFSQEAASADPFGAPIERVIAHGRLILCALFLWAAHFDPVELARYHRGACWLFIAYSVSAAALVGVTMIRSMPPAIRVSIHFVDIATISAVLLLTSAPGSP